MEWSLHHPSLKFPVIPTPSFLQSPGFYLPINCHRDGIFPATYSPGLFHLLKIFGTFASLQGKFLDLHKYLFLRPKCCTKKETNTGKEILLAKKDVLPPTDPAHGVAPAFFFSVHVAAKLFTKGTEMKKKKKPNVKASCLPSEALQPRDNP